MKKPSIFYGFSAESEFLQMTDNEFRDYCGGVIAVELFKGNLERTLYNILSMATARGMKLQWELDNK